MSRPDGERWSCLLLSLVVSLLLCLVSTLDFSRTRGVLYHLNSLTQFPSVSNEELVLPRCVLSRLRCNGHNFLFTSCLAILAGIENPSCSACGHPSQDNSYLILHCPATDSLSLYDLWSTSWGVARLLGLHDLPNVPIPRKRSGNKAYGKLMSLFSGFSLVAV